jgi:hypothetical protein
LNDEKWSANYFKESLIRFHTGLVTNKCAMERLILQLLGLNLRKKQDGSNLDFEYSSSLLKNGIEILKIIFGEEEEQCSSH